MSRRKRTPFGANRRLARKLNNFAVTVYNAGGWFDRDEMNAMLKMNISYYNETTGEIRVTQPKKHEEDNSE